MRSRGLILASLCVASLVTSQAARADQRPGRERIDFTAYTLRARELSLGLGAAAFGVLDEVTVGTYVAPWLAFPLLNAPVASGFVKVRDWFDGPVATSVRGTIVYLPATALSSLLLDDRTTRVGFAVVPLELSVSARLHARFSQSLQLTWVHVAVTGSRPPERDLDLRVGGASAVTSLSLSSLSELRLSRVVALTLRGTVLLGHGDLVVRGELERDGTRVDARLGAKELYEGVVANVIPGIALSWSNVNLHVGVGVGSNWLPFLGLPIRVIHVVPDADFYVRF